MTRVPRGQPLPPGKCLLIIFGGGLLIWLAVVFGIRQALS